MKIFKVDLKASNQQFNVTSAVSDRLKSNIWFVFSEVKNDVDLIPDVVKILSPSVYSDVEVQVDESSSVLCRPVKRVNLRGKRIKDNQLDPDVIF